MASNIHMMRNTKGKQESRTECKQDHNVTWTFTDRRVKDKKRGEGEGAELHQTGALGGPFAQL